MPYKRKSIWAVCAFLVVALASSAWSAPIIIVNPGFEGDALGSGLYTVGTFASGWTVMSGTAGAFHPNAIELAAGAPQGNNTAFIFMGGTLSQVLSTPLSAFTTYSLSVDIVNRSDYFLGGGYAIQLLAGGVLLAQDTNSVNPASGTFQVANLLFTEGNGPQVGQALEIRLIGLGPMGQPNFDNAVLNDSSGSPEPGSLSLFGIGAGLLGIARLRRRSGTAKGE